MSRRHPQRSGNETSRTGTNHQLFVRLSDTSGTKATIACLNFWPKAAWLADKGEEIPSSKIKEYSYKGYTYEGKYHPGGWVVLGVIILEDHRANEVSKETNSPTRG